MTRIAYPDGISAAQARPSGAIRSFLSVAVLGAILLAAALGIFGGTGSSVLRADAAAAEFTIRVPTTLRSGLFFEMTIDVTARQPLADATIAIPPSLWRGMTINTTMPEPSEEAFEDGRLRLHFGPLPAGSAMAIKVDGQINPDLFAGTQGEVALFDGDRAVASVPVHMTVLP